MSFIKYNIKQNLNIEDIANSNDLSEDGALLREMSFRNILLKISSTYINIPVEQIADKIYEGMKEIGEFVSADRVYIFRYEFDKNTTSNRYEWCAEGINPEIQNLQNVPLDDIPQWVRLHQNGELLYIPDVLSLGEDYDGLRSYLEPQGIKSLITIPLIDKGNLIGFLGFDSVKKHHFYSLKEQQLLFLFAEIIVNVRARRNNEEAQAYLLDITQKQRDKLQNFTHIVSHNLKSHSENIVSLLRLLNEENPEIGALNYFKYLMHASENLKESINNLSQVANIQTSENHLLTPVNLSNIVNKVINNIIALAQTSGVTIINELKGDEIISGDPVYLDSIILNFLTNAIRYRSDNRNSYVKLATYNEDKYTVLFIEDNGIGIDLDRNRHKLFGMYKTFHQHPESRGVGLFIAKNQIDALGGKVDVESEVDKGTIFKIYFLNHVYDEVK